jgi:hypothetical protein
MSRPAERHGLHRFDVELLRCLLGERLRGTDTHSDAHTDADGHRADADGPTDQLA